jgi:hypothetical protein
MWPAPLGRPDIAPVADRSTNLERERFRVATAFILERTHTGLFFPNTTMIAPATVNLIANAGNFVSCALLPRDTVMEGTLNLTTIFCAFPPAGTIRRHQSLAHHSTAVAASLEPLVPVNNATRNTQRIPT